MTLITILTWYQTWSQQLCWTLSAPASTSPGCGRAGTRTVARTPEIRMFLTCRSMLSRLGAGLLCSIKMLIVLDQIRIFHPVSIYAVLGFPEPKWSPTFVLPIKGRPIKRRGHPPQKERLPPKKEERVTYGNLGAKKYCIYACKYVALILLFRIQMHMEIDDKNPLAILDW